MNVGQPIGQFCLLNWLSGQRPLSDSKTNAVFIKPSRTSIGPEIGEIGPVVSEITCLESRPLKRNKEKTSAKHIARPLDKHTGRYAKQDITHQGQPQARRFCLRISGSLQTHAVLRKR